MNTIDIVLIVIFLIAFFVGFKTGLLLTLASLAGIIAGVLGAIYFSGFAAGYLDSWFDWSEQLIQLVAFAVTFFIIVLFFSILGRVLTKMINFVALGIVNKLLGGAFNVLKYAFLISAILMFLNASDTGSTIISEENKEASILYPPIVAIAPMLLPSILEKVDVYKEELDDDENLETPSEENPEEAPEIELIPETTS